MFRSFCWWAQDDVRESHAREILIQNRLYPPQYGANADTFVTSCRPSSGPSPYQLSMSRSGKASCTCPDFYDRGGACKHLCALHIVIEGWVIQGLEKPFHYPSTLKLAQELARLHAPKISTSLAPTPCPSLKTANWIILQDIGGDAILLGETFNTGTGSDSTETCSSGSEDEPASYSSQQTAIGVQLNNRLCQEVTGLLPRLHGLENLLGDAAVLPSSSEFTELQQVIAGVSSELSRLQLAASPPPSVPPSLPASPE